VYGSRTTTRGPGATPPCFACQGGWLDRGFFAALAERLAARHRVIRLDWRGHGDSSRPPTDFGHEQLADDADAVIEASGVRRVVPVSQAHGGWAAVELRRRLGDRVEAIVASSWLVLDPPLAFVGALEALQDPERGRDAREQLFSMWLTVLRRASSKKCAGRWAPTTSTCARGRRGRPRPATPGTETPCGRSRRSIRSRTSCICSRSHGPRLSRRAGDVLGREPMVLGQAARWREPLPAARAPGRDGGRDRAFHRVSGARIRQAPLAPALPFGRTSGRHRLLAPTSSA
jgi:pimeloyl-ACP methyl ester carboxylesterase